MEIQDIFITHMPEYLNHYTPSLVQHKAIHAISDCRTAKLGGHMDVCPSCGEVSQSYNSCRNRHCPKCQTLSKEK